jgi:asparagine synthase (glutamine-hydrolysing)
MDSTAVALIADDWIRAGAGEAPLHTLSLVYHQLPGLARETVYLDSVPARSGIVPHRIPADNLLDFDSFADPPLHDEPYAMLWRLGMDRALVETAAACGAATMLTGIGADELLDVQPFYLTDLLRSGHFRTAWTEACKWARCDNCSPWAMLYPFGIGPLLPAWMRGGPVRALLRSGHTTSISNQHNWHIPPWITRSFAHRYALREQTLSATHPHDRTGQPVGVSFALASIASRTGEVGSWAVAAPQGIAVAHPFLDARVVCLGLGMQRRLRPEPGRLKPVLAEAMRDVLPAKIRDRRRKGQFNEVYYLGLARNLQPLEAMIRHAPIDDLGVFDKEVLVRCLHEAALGGAQVGQLHRLNLTLSFIKWLCMQPVWQGSLEPPTEVIRARWHDSLTAAGPSR